ncbi:MAG TPA: YiiX/YebB-like N1pC/P60 family cysteine hydrolase [Gemmataceae bacterium]|nr:YiiX/YebB-like N1pC/P60 family cysteine hydrolase [Gemmataceae bacterium]
MGSANPARWFGRLAACCLALAGAGCALPSSPTNATVPAEWRRTNPWGPEAFAARAEGKFQSRFCTQEMADWKEFARRTIQDGDILFRYGKSYKPYEMFTSCLIAGIEDNRFSHDGIAHWEGDTLYIYDAEPPPEGIRKVPFEFWMLDTAEGSLVVKRLVPQYRCCIPQAIAYCEDVWLRQVPFDAALRPDDSELYCSEMIEKSYRSAGLVLSDTLPIRCLPHYRRWLWLYPALSTFTKIRVDVPVFALGNRWYGTYGSQLLETVYEQCPDRREDRREPPICSDGMHCTAKPPSP